MSTDIKLQPQIPTPIDSTGFAAFYEMVRLASEALSFKNYSNFMTAVLCGSKEGLPADVKNLLPKGDCDPHLYSGMRSYDLISEVTNLFVGAQALLIEDCCGCHDNAGTHRVDVSQIRAELRDVERQINDVRDKPSESERYAELLMLQVNLKNREHEVQNADRDTSSLMAMGIGPCSLDEIRQRFRMSEAEFTSKHLLNLANRLFNKPSDSSCERWTATGAPIAASKVAANGAAPTDRVFSFMQQLMENQEGVSLKDCSLGSGNCSGMLISKLRCPPMLELIWSYWMEQGMLVQGLNALTLRYQNRRPIGRDPLTRCDISPLRPLNNIFWGYIQRENDRLTVARRAYEYDHHYGLRLDGQAVPRMNPADSRSQFIEAFHRLLGEAARFYRTSMDTTMNADGFPILNSLRELHLVLAEGAHNQFGDLPTTARSEMLMQQWIIGRPEVRDFLGGRPGVPYPERWMPHLETLRQMMGWADTTVRHYRDLATFGERLLLSIRYLPWSTVNDGEVAKVWAQYWRQEVQAYLHAYRAVTGVDLGLDDVRIQQSGVHLIQPSDLIRRRRVAIAQTMGA